VQLRQHGGAKHFSPYLILSSALPQLMKDDGSQWHRRWFCHSGSRSQLLRNGEHMTLRVLWWNWVFVYKKKPEWRVRPYVEYPISSLWLVEFVRMVCVCLTWAAEGALFKAPTPLRLANIVHVNDAVPRLKDGRLLRSRGPLTRWPGREQEFKWAICSLYPALLSSILAVVMGIKEALWVKGEVKLPHLHSPHHTLSTYHQRKIIRSSDKISAAVHSGPSQAQGPAPLLCFPTPHTGTYTPCQQNTLILASEVSSEVDWCVALSLQFE